MFSSSQEASGQFHACKSFMEAHNSQSFFRVTLSFEKQHHQPKRNYASNTLCYNKYTEDVLFNFFNIKEKNSNSWIHNR